MKPMKGDFMMNYAHVLEIAIFTQDEDSYAKIDKELQWLSEMFGKGYFLRRVTNKPGRNAITYEDIETPISSIDLHYKTPYFHALHGLDKELVVMDDSISVSEDMWRDSLMATINQHDGRVILLSDFLKLPMGKYLSGVSDYQKQLCLDAMANNFLMKNGIAPIYEVREHWSRMCSNDYNKYLEYIEEGDNTNEEHL